MSTPGVAMNQKQELVRAFPSAKFTGEERHLRRLEKIKRLESDERWNETCKRKEQRKP